MDASILFLSEATSLMDLPSPSYSFGALHFAKCFQSQLNLMHTKYLLNSGLRLPDTSQLRKGRSKDVASGVSSHQPFQSDGKNRLRWAQQSLLNAMEVSMQRRSQWPLMSSGPDAFPWV